MRDKQVLFGGIEYLTEIYHRSNESLCCSAPPTPRPTRRKQLQERRQANNLNKLLTSLRYVSNCARNLQRTVTHMSLIPDILSPSYAPVTYCT
jgi:hypothetical protein